MDNDRQVYTTFAIDFGDAARSVGFAEAIIDAAEQDGGFALLAESVEAKVALKLGFADAASKTQMLDPLRDELRQARSSLLDRYECRDVDEKTAVFIMGGTLSDCLETAAGTLNRLQGSIGLMESFEKAMAGHHIHPEITSFYRWMDAKVNGRLQGSQPR